MGLLTEEHLAWSDEAPPMFIFNLFGELCGPPRLRSDGLPKATSDRTGPALPHKRVMAGGTELVFQRPIRAGDVLVGVRRLTDIYEKQGSTGPLIFQVRELNISTVSGEPVMKEIQTSIAR
jgi:3-methylfumaryl-CoA hydratase